MQLASCFIWYLYNVNFPHYHSDAQGRCVDERSCAYIDLGQLPPDLGECLTLLARHAPFSKASSTYFLTLNPRIPYVQINVKVSVITFKMCFMDFVCVLLSQCLEILAFIVSAFLFNPCFFSKNTHRNCWNFHWCHLPWMQKQNKKICSCKLHF